MPQDDMLVLRGGDPPIRGKKVVYWRERAFQARIHPPPIIPSYAPIPAEPAAFGPGDAARYSTPEEAEEICAALEAGGYDPPPPSHADEAAWRRWSLHYLDQAYGRAPRRPNERD